MFGNPLLQNAVELVTGDAVGGGHLDTKNVDQIRFKIHKNSIKIR